MGNPFTDQSPATEGHLTFMHVTLIFVAVFSLVTLLKISSKLNT